MKAVLVLLIVVFISAGVLLDRGVPISRQIASAEVVASSESNDPIDGIRRILYVRTIMAHLHEQLLEKYGVEANSIVKWVENENDRFTESAHLMTTSQHDEWPMVMGNALYLLNDPYFWELCDHLEGLRSQKAGAAEIRTLLLQSELWTAFDELYLIGLNPDGRFDIDAERWHYLLWQLGVTIAHLAPSYQDAATFQKGGTVVLHRLPEVGHEVELVEVSSFERPMIHDWANRFRKRTRVFYYDPQIDFRDLSEEHLGAFATRQQPLNPGAVAVLEESIIAIAQGPGMLLTNIPFLYKTYVVEEPLEESRLRFGMYRIDQQVARLEDARPIAVPPDAEGWSDIDLPNVPGRLQPAFRAPLAVSCRSCHYSTPNSFAPHSAMDPSLFRLSSAKGGRMPQRTLGMMIKSESAEFQLLRHYFQLEVQENPPPKPSADRVRIP